MYEPVCGGEKTYFSPCHAGCTTLQTYNTPDGLTVKVVPFCKIMHALLGWLRIRSNEDNLETQKGNPYLLGRDTCQIGGDLFSVAGS